MRLSAVPVGHLRFEAGTVGSRQIDYHLLAHALKSHSVPFFATLEQRLGLKPARCHP
jgi:hypothetical protein